METRSARKNREILEAATTVFLRSGYVGCSMDEVAALAKVSKQTVYKHYTDKEHLFTTVVAALMGPIAEGNRSAAAALEDADDLGDGLRQLARSLLVMLRDPQVLQLRRLVMAEAERFPALGRTYWEQAFHLGLETVATALRKASAQGPLKVDDPEAAAGHFAGLVLWIPMNRAMFCGLPEEFTDAEIDQRADQAVRAFLAAYG
ncbi:TetR/AcrR family transcriptional regulator [Sinosporangium siamense]|uniref:TetR/AcrR family transcriptional regulator n=1 Tax=Sinosporangium siamense TaxID=1367973 RepID=UPI001EF234E2|nr:TetR/AcrR family transcriptional regulator [Sinosporangium siamense]